MTRLKGIESTTSRHQSKNASAPSERKTSSRERNPPHRSSPVVEGIEPPDDVTARGLLDVRALVVENLRLHLRQAFV